MATLTEYQTHLEKFGPEMVLGTAVHDLSEHELGELKALIESKERVNRWKDGRWRERHQRTRVCEECRLELPATASGRMRRHPHCKKRVQRRRTPARCVSRGSKRGLVGDSHCNSSHTHDAIIGEAAKVHPLVNTSAAWRDSDSQSIPV